MDFIRLTYYKKAKNYGSSAGNTHKNFYLAINSIIRITEYNESTKISLNTGDDIEVAEDLQHVAEALQNARPLHTELSIDYIHEDTNIISKPSFNDSASYQRRTV